MANSVFVFVKSLLALSGADISASPLINQLCENVGPLSNQILQQTRLPNMNCPSLLQLETMTFHKLPELHSVICQLITLQPLIEALPVLLAYSCSKILLEFESDSVVVPNDPQTAPFVGNVTASPSTITLTDPYSRVMCTLLGSGNSRSMPLLQDCAVNVQLAVTSERRHNPSLLIQLLQNPSTRGVESVTHQFIIDMGKTFRASMLDQFSRCAFSEKHGRRGESDGLPRPTLLPHFNAVLLTHAHSDAVDGIDDFREFAPHYAQLILADNQCLAAVRAKFSYAFQSPSAVASAGLFVPCAITEPLIYFEPYDLVPGQLTILPIPLQHGACICAGFLVRTNGGSNNNSQQIVYFSDLQCRALTRATSATRHDRKSFAAHQPHDDYLSCFVEPVRTLALLRQCPIVAVFIDALRPSEYYPSHASWFEAEQIIEALQRRGVFDSNTPVWAMGMSEHLTPDWYMENQPQRLKMSFEGMRVSCNPVFDTKTCAESQ